MEEKSESLEKKKLLKRLLNKKALCLVLLALVILIGAFIRIQNLPLLQDKYTIELDTDYFLRMTETINEKGYLPQNDTLRYAPIGFDSRDENNFLSFTMVYTYKTLHFFNKSITLEKAVILHPVIFFILGMIAFYFLIKEIFDEYTALIASLLLVIIPAYLQRTMAGFSDKESIGMFLMFLALLFIIKSEKEKKPTISGIYSLLSGIITGLMGLAWGGFKFSIIIIAAYYLMLFLLGKITLRSVTNYTLWMIPFTILTATFIGKYGGLKGLVSSSTSGFVYLVFGILIIGFFVNRAKRFDKILTKIPLPRETTILLALIVIGSLASYLILGQTAITNLITDAQGMLLRGITNSRLGLTVAESKQPYFYDWYQSFGFTIVLFFIGISLVFSKALNELQYKKTLIVLFTLFLVGIIISRSSENTLLNGETMISDALFFATFALLLIYGAYTYLKSYNKDKELFGKIQNPNIYLAFFVIWLVVVMLAARGGIRLFMIFAPVLCTVIAFLAISLSKYVFGLTDKFYKTIGIITILLVIVPIIYANTSTSYYSAKYTGPGFDNQWQNAMTWVKENTQKDAVFAHWWDYGYWIQTRGERATITDGGNFIPYWNHLMGRHVLSAKNETEALEFLNAHGATHLLIISDEIGKYTAYSSIGSDENFDIFSWISTFVMNAESTIQEGDTYTYFFSGATALDENFVYQDKVFPQNEAYIAGFIIPVKEIDDTYEIKQPKAVLFYRNERTDVPVECVYDEKKIIYNETGLKGCLRIFPRYLNNKYQQENGALLYVSRKGIDALWTKLFLFDEKSKYFEIGYDDSSLNQLAYYNGRILGPIKIWKINYPKNFTISNELKQEYLAKTTPEWMKLDGITI